MSRQTLIESETNSEHEKLKVRGETLTKESDRKERNKELESCLRKLRVKGLALNWQKKV